MPIQKLIHRYHNQILRANWLEKMETADLANQRARFVNDFDNDAFDGGQLRKEGNKRAGALLRISRQVCVNLAIVAVDSHVCTFLMFSKKSEV